MYVDENGKAKQRDLAIALADEARRLAEPAIIGPQEVARLTGLSRKKIRKLTLAGVVPFAYQLPSGIYRYHRTAVKEWFDSLSNPLFVK